MTGARAPRRRMASPRIFRIAEEAQRAAHAHWSTERRAAARAGGERTVQGSGLGLEQATLSPVPASAAAAAPYQAVGWLYYQAGGQDLCATATLCIDAQTLVTAAHVLWSDGMPTSQLLFEFVTPPPTGPASFALAGFILPEQYETDPNPAFDVALCRLSVVAAVAPVAFSTADLADYILSQVTVVGLPQTPLGVFPFNGEQLWQSVSVFEGSSVFDPVLYAASLMTVGADGGPWFAASDPLTGAGPVVIVGVSASQAGATWGSPSFLGWIAILYDRLTGANAIPPGGLWWNGAELLGQGPMSLAYQDDVLFVAGEHAFQTLCASDLSPSGSDTFSSSWWMATPTSMYADGQTVYLANNRSVFCLNPDGSCGPECAPGWFTASGSPPYSLTSMPVRVRSSWNNLNEILFAAGGGYVYPILPGPGPILPGLEQPAGTGPTSIAPAGTATMMVNDYGSIWAPLVLVGCGGQISLNAFGLVYSNSDPSRLLAFPQITWTVPLPGANDLVAVLVTAYGYWAASNGNLYYLAKNSGTPTITWTIDLGQAGPGSGIAMATGGGFVLAVAPSGAFVVLSTSGVRASRGKVQSSGPVSVVALDAGEFAFVVGSAFYLLDAATSSVTPLPAMVAPGAALTTNPDDPTTLYVASSGTVGLISLDQGPHTLSAGRAAPPPPEARRARVRQWRSRGLDLAVDPVSVETRRAHLTAYWTPEKKAAACRLPEGASSSSGAAVSGAVPDPAAQPYACVGELCVTLDGVDYVGAGTLIGRETVLTAAHLLYSSDFATNVQFSVGGQTYGVSALYAPPEWMDAHQPGYDVGVVVLGSPVPVPAGGWVTISTGDLPATIQSVGYQSVGSVMTMFQCTGAVVSEDTQLATMVNPLAPGMDGGPWFDGSTPGAVLGVNSLMCGGTWCSPVFGDWVFDFVNGLAGGPAGSVTCPAAAPFLELAAFAGNLYAVAAGEIFMVPCVDGLSQEEVQQAGLAGVNGPVSLDVKPPSSEMSSDGVVYCGCDGQVFGFVSGVIGPEAAYNGDMGGCGGGPTGLAFVPGTALGNVVITACNGWLFAMDDELEPLAGIQNAAWKTPATFGAGTPNVASDGQWVAVAVDGAYLTTQLTASGWSLSHGRGQLTDASCGVTNVVAVDGYAYIGDEGQVWQVSLADGLIAPADLPWTSTSEVRLATDGMFVYAACAGTVVMLDPNAFGTPVWAASPPSMADCALITLACPQGMLLACGGGNLVQLDPTSQGATLASYALGPQLPLDYRLTMDPFDPFVAYVSWGAYVSPADDPVAAGVIGIRLTAVPPEWAGPEPAAPQANSQSR